MRGFERYLALLVVCLAALILGCQKASPPATTSAPPPPPPRAAMEGRPRFQPGWDMLYPGHPEDEEYGLFSYVLFGVNAQPESSSYLRYKAAIKALSDVQQAEVLAREGNVRKADINAIYFPLKSSLASDGHLPPPETVLAAYDFDTARALLARVRSGPFDGPYLVSVSRPLRGAAQLDPSRMIFQDLSSVPPDLVGLWVDCFRRQAVQERFWEKSGPDEFVKNLRTAIGVTSAQFSDFGGVLASFVWMGRRPSP